MVKFILIKDLTDIRFGLNAKSANNERIRFIQGKDFDEYGKLLTHNLYTVSEPTVREIDFLKPGEVLFASKGMRNYAVVWEGIDRLAVASSTFFRLSVFNQNVIPAYIAWYLNSTIAKSYFQKHVRSTTIFTISKKVFEELPVPLPDLQLQEQIVRLHYLSNQERSLMNDLIEKKEIYIEKLLANTLNTQQ